VRDAVSLIEPDVRRHEVDVRLQLAAPSPSVLVDGVQIVQVILNLAINGVEAMAATGRPGGRLTIVTRTTPTHAEVVISDTGPGVSEEIEARLFEPFFTTKQGGLGMGLSIARAIVEAVGGRLSIEPADEVGTTFLVTLPLGDADA
jgi:signal transduction histidine kinase